MLFRTVEYAPLRGFLVARCHVGAQTFPQNLLTSIKAHVNHLLSVVDGGGVPRDAIVGGIRNVLHLGLGHRRSDGQRNGIPIL